MNDLPTPASQGTINNQQLTGNIGKQLNKQSDQDSGVPTSVDKEKEAMRPGGLEAPALREVGQEAPLPSEVGAAGVKLHPTSVTIPPSVGQMGVRAVGDTAVTATAPTVALPLSDDQIAVGLHKSITDSWRWLAEWCIRKLKQLHMALKKVHGKFIRTQV